MQTIKYCHKCKKNTTHEHLKCPPWIVFFLTFSWFHMFGLCIIITYAAWYMHCHKCLVCYPKVFVDLDNWNRKPNYPVFITKLLEYLKPN